MVGLGAQLGLLPVPERCGFLRGCSWREQPEVLVRLLSWAAVDAFAVRATNQGRLLRGRRPLPRESAVRGEVVSRPGGLGRFSVLNQPLESFCARLRVLGGAVVSRAARSGSTSAGPGLPSLSSSTFRGRTIRSRGTARDLAVLRLAGGFHHHAQDLGLFVQVGWADQIRAGGGGGDGGGVAGARCRGVEQLFSVERVGMSTPAVSATCGPCTETFAAF